MIMISSQILRALGASLMLICSGLLSSVSAKPGKQFSEILATFGNPVQIFGDMIRNDIDFVDGLKVNVYSPTNRTLTVEQNENPLSGAFVTGTTGSGFRLARGYSYKFKTNEPANDMIAQIAIPYDPSQLQNRSLVADNTFVAQLAGDSKAWSVVDRDRTVQTARFKTAMSQMTSLDGEYVILARSNQDTGNIFMEFGEGDQFSANFTGGPGRQDVEFMDGLRFSVQTDRPLRMNAQLKYPIAPEEIPQGMISLNSYAWVINTTVNAQITPGTPGAPNVPGAPAAGNSSGIAAAAPVPIPANSVQPAVSASPFVYAQPRKPGRVRRAAPEPIAQPMPAASAAPMPMPDMPMPMPGMEPAPNAPMPPMPDMPGMSPAPNAPMPGMPGMPIPNAPSMSMSMPPGMTMAPPAPPVVAPPPPAAPSAAPPTAPPADVQAAQIQFPINMNTLQSRLVPQGQQGAQAAGNAGLAPLDLNTIAFTIGRRDSNAAPNTAFTPMAMNGMNSTGMQGQNAAGMMASGISLSGGRLVFDSRTMLDGEYVILVPVQPGLGGAAPAAPSGAPAPPAGKAQTGSQAQAQAAEIKASEASGVTKGSVAAMVGAFAACAFLL